MATKDWKKILRKDAWEKRDERIYVSKYYSNSPYAGGGWLVISSEKGEISEWFKTKSQALAYARAYMRTH